MKKSYTLLTKSVSLMFLMITLSCFSQNQELTGKIKGSWSGALKVNSVELTLVINIIVDEKENFVVTIDSPDQGVNPALAQGG